MFSAPSTPKPIQFDLNSKSPNMSPPKPDLWGDSTWPGVLEQLNMMLNYERGMVLYIQVEIYILLARISYNM